MVDAAVGPQHPVAGAVTRAGDRDERTRWRAARRSTEASDTEREHDAVARGRRTGRRDGQRERQRDRAVQRRDRRERAQYPFEAARLSTLPIGSVPRTSPPLACTRCSSPSLPISTWWRWSPMSSNGGGATTSSARASAGATGAPDWVFYEGPPTANGQPGIHHVWARLFKDIYPAVPHDARQARACARAAGTATGCPVEVQVEKELGFSGKHADRGIRHRASSTRSAALRCSATSRTGSRSPSRIGMWLDTKDAYWTLSNEFIETRLVAVPRDVGQRRHLRRLQGRAVLRPLRHRAVESRARSAGRVPRRHRAVGLRALPASRARLRPRRVDDHAVDAAVERRRRGGPTRAVRACARPARRPRPRARREPRHRRARRGRGRRRAGRRRASSWACTTSDRSTSWPSTTRSRAWWSRPTSSRSTTAPASCTSRPRSARSTAR